MASERIVINLKGNGTWLEYMAATKGTNKSEYIRGLIEQDRRDAPQAVLDGYEAFSASIERAKEA